MRWLIELLRRKAQTERDAADEETSSTTGQCLRGPHCSEPCIPIVESRILPAAIWDTLLPTDQAALVREALMILAATDPHALRRAVAWLERDCVAPRQAGTAERFTPRLCFFEPDFERYAESCRLILKRLLAVRGALTFVYTGEVPDPLAAGDHYGDHDPTEETAS